MVAENDPWNERRGKLKVAAPRPRSPQAKITDANLKNSGNPANTGPTYHRTWETGLEAEI